MAEELSYIAVTPYSLLKSRTGGIISRAVSRTGLDLVRARVFAPGEAFAREFAEMLPSDPEPRHRATQELLRDYVATNFPPGPDGRRRRVLLLVFRGENAVEKVHDTVGHIVHQRTVGETIRDTYGDYVCDPDGRVRYFEPAALAPPDPASARRELELWAAYSDSDGGIIDPGTPGAERTLVLLKPDNFQFPNVRAGNVIDILSRTGLAIVGIKVHRMSVAEAADFYGPVLPALHKVFLDPATTRCRIAVEREFGFPLPDDVAARLGALVAPIHARAHWESIVEFMTGARPSDCPDDRKAAPGSQKSIALVYEGPDAIGKVRAVLGPTDPSKAPPGSIRREFGQTIMINAAHASDSPENARKEIGILRMDENNLKPLIETFYQTA